MSGPGVGLYGDRSCYVGSLGGGGVPCSSIYNSNDCVIFSKGILNFRFGLEVKLRFCLGGLRRVRLFEPRDCCGRVGSVGGSFCRVRATLVSGFKGPGISGADGGSCYSRNFSSGFCLCR